MTRQDISLLGLRLVLLSAIGALVYLTIGEIESSGVKAPLLTMMGGATIVAIIYPPRSITIHDLAQDLFTVVGTGIAIAGGVYWLDDAVQTTSADKLPLISFLVYSLTLILGIHLIASPTIAITANRDRIKARMRIVRDEAGGMKRRFTARMKAFVRRLWK